MKRVLDEQFVKAAVGKGENRQVYRRVKFHVNEDLSGVTDVTWTESSDKETKEWEEVDSDKARELEQQFQGL